MKIELVEEDRRGPLSIVRMPEKGRFYSMGVDSSEGTRDGDPSAIVVIDMHDMEQVAWWHGHCDPRELGRKSVWLGHFYNEAYVVPEANHTGIPVIYEMRELCYPNLFRRVTYDQAAKVFQKALGFRTDVKTRPWLWSLGRQTVRQGWGRINSREQLKEMMHLAYDERGEVVHPKNGHDDLTIAWLLAVVGRDQAYREKLVDPEPVKPRDFDERHWDLFDKELEEGPEHDDDG